ISGLYRNALQPACGKLEQSVTHRSDPQRSLAILSERHDAFVGQRVGMAHESVDVDRLTRIRIKLEHAPAQRADPYLVPGSVRKRRHELVQQPFRSLSAQLPAVRIPTADTAGLRSYPDQARLILVQRDDDGVAERFRIVGIVAIVIKRAARAVQQIETVRSA